MTVSRICSLSSSGPKWTRPNSWAFINRRSFLREAKSRKDRDRVITKENNTKTHWKRGVVPLVNVIQIMVAAFPEEVMCYACPTSPDWSVPALPASGLEAKIVPYPVDQLWRFLIGYCS